MLAVVKVVVLVVDGGGKQLLYMGPPRAHLWSSFSESLFSPLPLRTTLRPATPSSTGGEWPPSTPSACGWPRWRRRRYCSTGASTWQRRGSRGSSPPCSSRVCRRGTLLNRKLLLFKDCIIPFPFQYRRNHVIVAVRGGIGDAGSAGESGQ